MGLVGIFAHVEAKAQGGFEQVLRRDDLVRMVHDDQVWRQRDGRSGSQRVFLFVLLIEIHAIVVFDMQIEYSEFLRGVLCFGVVEDVRVVLGLGIEPAQRNEYTRLARSYVSCTVTGAVWGLRVCASSRCGNQIIVGLVVEAMSVLVATVDTQSFFCSTGAGTYEKLFLTKMILASLCDSNTIFHRSSPRPNLLVASKAIRALAIELHMIVNISLQTIREGRDKKFNGNP